MRWFVSLVLLLGACSSSSGPAAADGPPLDAGAGTIADAPPRTSDAATANCPITWLEDGALRCASVPIATFNASATGDVLDVSGVDISSGPTGIDFIVAAADPFAVPQTFNCENPQPHSMAQMTYTPGFMSGTATSCTVNVTQVGAPGGAHAIGSFAGVIAITGGGTRTITNGTFDVALRQ